MNSSSSCPTFNVEEEVVVIRNGWTQKKKKKINILDQAAGFTLSFLTVLLTP